MNIVVSGGGKSCRGNRWKMECRKVCEFWAAAAVPLLWFGLDVTLVVGEGGRGGELKAVASPPTPRSHRTEVKPKARRHFCSINGKENNSNRGSCSQKRKKKDSVGH